MQTKLCPKCEQHLLLDQFHKHKGKGPLGLKSWCKACDNANMAERRKAFGIIGPWRAIWPQIGIAVAAEMGVIDEGENRDLSARQNALLKFWGLGAGDGFHQLEGPLC